MRLVLLAIVLAATPVYADVCDGDPARFTDYTPAGCPWYSVVRSDVGPVSTNFVLARGGSSSTVSAAVTVERGTRRVFEQVLDASSCERHWEYVTHDVDVYEVTIANAQPGDRLTGQLGEFRISAPGPCLPSRSFEPLRCWPDEDELRAAGCEGAPTRSPRCVDDAKEYLEPVWDKGIGARCPANLVATAPIVGGATFELYKPPPTTGAFILAATRRVDAPEVVTTQRGEYTCSGGAQNPVDRLVYTVQFEEAAVGDLIMVHDDESELARTWLTGAESCTMFRSEWCWVEETCEEPTPPPADGGCSTGHHGGLLGVGLALALLRMRRRE